MVKTIVAALKPMNIFCAFFGYFYIKENRTLSDSNKKLYLFDIIEAFRCCSLIYLYIYISISTFQSYYEQLLSTVVNLDSRLKAVVGFLDYLGVSINNQVLSSYRPIQHKTTQDSSIPLSAGQMCQLRVRRQPYMSLISEPMRYRAGI